MGGLSSLAGGLTGGLTSAFGALGGLGGVLGLAENQYDRNIQRSQFSRSMNFNRQEAQKDRDFQERMAATAYQRATKDLEAAGLNRVLALGSPSPTPSGATASSSPGSVAVRNSVERMLQGQMLNNAKATEEKLKQEGRLTKANADKAEVEKAAYDLLLPLINKAKDIGGDYLKDWFGLSEGSEENSAKSVMDWRDNVQETYEKIKKMTPKELRYMKDLQDERLGRKKGSEKKPQTPKLEFNGKTYYKRGDTYYAE